jgi:dethiobiotin synthase
MQGSAHPWIIIGTDTEVGKTIVTAGILRLAAASSVTAAAVKLVQTGCKKDPASHRLIAPDPLMYQDALACLNPPPLHPPYFQTSYRFEPACSPHLAAEIHHQHISLNRLQETVLDLQKNYAFVIAEAAGGLLVPLNPVETTLDLVRRLQPNVLVVADNRLGMINHTLLTLHTLQNAGIPARGVILNNTSPQRADEKFLREDNRRTVALFGKTKVLAEIPFIKDFDPQSDISWSAIDRELRSLSRIFLFDSP